MVPGRRGYNYAAPLTSREDPEAGLFKSIYQQSLRVWRPAWDGKLTVIRIYPARDPERPGQFLPWRLDETPNSWGNWFRAYPIVHRLGNPQRTFIAYDHCDPTYDRTSNPYAILRDNVEEAIKNGWFEDSWGKALAHTKQGIVLSNRFLPAIASAGLVQCAMYMHADKPLIPPRGSHPQYPTICMLLKNTALYRMLKRMQEKRPGYAGDPFDFENAYLFGDPVSIDAGKFVSFYQEGHAPPEQYYQGGFFNPQAQQPVQRGTGFTRDAHAMPEPGGGSSDDKKSYDVRIDPSFNGYNPDLREFSDLIYDIVRDWDEVLDFPDHHRILMTMCESLPPSLVAFGLKGSQYFDGLPDQVRNRTSVAFPGQPQPQYGHGQAAYGGPGAAPSPSGFARPVMHQPDPRLQQSSASGFARQPLPANNQTFAEPPQGQPTQYAPPGQPTQYAPPAPQYAPPAPAQQAPAQAPSVQQPPASASGFSRNVPAPAHAPAAIVDPSVPREQLPPSRPPLASQQRPYVPPPEEPVATEPQMAVPVHPATHGMIPAAAGPAIAQQPPVQQAPPAQAPPAQAPPVQQQATPAQHAQARASSNRAREIAAKRALATQQGQQPPQ